MSTAAGPPPGRPGSPDADPQDSAAHQLQGMTLPDGWQVLNKVDHPTDHTGGAFSVSYLATHPSGHMGFLKAFDYAQALADPDPARALADVTSTYNAERDLLAFCGNRRLNRVVRVLAADTVRVKDVTPDAVSYLILELASGDARDAVAAADPGDQLPMLRLAHHAAVALSQLHSIGVCHQDVKPSNLLVWDTGIGPSGKLGDLGCAHMPGRPAPHDDLLVAGDCSYASPEQLYRAPEYLPGDQRRLAVLIGDVGAAADRWQVAECCVGAVVVVVVEPACQGRSAGLL